MSTAMDWSQNFCLSCDNANHTAAPYCSEACRLSDMDRSTTSNPHSALYSQSYSSTASSTWGMTDSKRNSVVSIQSGSYSARTPSMPAGSYPSSPNTTSFFASSSAPSRSSTGRHHHHSQSKRSLASSSSRSSLASINAPSHGLSDQTVAQLRYYVSSFDQSRDYKRRGTLS